MKPKTIISHRKLADAIARSIFAAGDELNDKVQRMEFKGGRYPDKETNLGGFCERAMADHIVTTLDDLLYSESGGVER